VWNASSQNASHCFRAVAGFDRSVSRVGARAGFAILRQIFVRRSHCPMGNRSWQGRCDTQRLRMRRQRQSHQLVGSNRRSRHHRGLYRIASSITFFWTTDMVCGPMGQTFHDTCADPGSCSSAPKICSLKPSAPGAARAAEDPLGRPQGASAPLVPRCAGGSDRDIMRQRFPRSPLEPASQPCHRSSSS